MRTTKQTPDKGGRVNLAVRMLPVERDRWAKFAAWNGRSGSEQARLVLVRALEAWERRRVAVGE